MEGAEQQASQKTLRKMPNARRTAQQTAVSPQKFDQSTDRAVSAQLQSIDERQE
jgi:hypothetical protein